jgi:hypothetical protein
MPTHNFNVKITTGKRTDLEITVLGTAVNKKTIQFSETDSALYTNEMGAIIEEAIHRALRAWIFRKNFAENEK